MMRHGTSGIGRIGPAGIALLLAVIAAAAFFRGGAGAEPGTVPPPAKAPAGRAGEAAPRPAGAKTGREWWGLFWNVEAYATDLPRHGAEPATPAALAEKRRRLAQVIERVDFGRGPDLVGLAEVGSKEAVERLLGKGYRVFVPKEKSSIHVALAVREGIPVGVPRALDPGTTGRAILEEGVRLGEHPLEVFVVHLKSKANARSEEDREGTDEALRSKEAIFLRRKVDPLLSAGADVLVMGDFNEDYRDSLFQRELPTKIVRRGERRRREGAPDERLRNFGGALEQSFPERGTFYYYPDWSLIDNLLASPALAAKGGLFLSPGDVFIGVSWDLLDRYGEPARFDPRCPTGASDHLPVIFRIRSGGAAGKGR